MEIAIDREYLSKCKVMIATPMYGGTALGTYTNSMTELARCALVYGFQVVNYFISNESLITRARNYCADTFLRSDCTHLMFIDADIGFNPQDVMAMLLLQRPESEYDILGGAYPKKNISWEKVKVAVDKGFADENPNNLENYVGDFVFNPAPGINTFSVSEPVEVLEIGTGFMMIKRTAFELFKKTYSRVSYKPDHVRTADFDGSREIEMYFQAEIDQFDSHDLFATALKNIAGNDGHFTSTAIAQEALDKYDELIKADSKRYLSEDYYFTQKIRKAGGKVWLLPWIQLSHTGTYQFGGSIKHMAELNVSATCDPNMLGKKLN